MGNAGVAVACLGLLLLLICGQALGIGSTQSCGLHWPLLTELVAQARVGHEAPYSSLGAVVPTDRSVSLKFQTPFHLHTGSTTGTCNQTRALPTKHTFSRLPHGGVGAPMMAQCLLAWVKLWTVFRKAQLPSLMKVREQFEMTFTNMSISKTLKRLLL